MTNLSSNACMRASTSFFPFTGGFMRSCNAFLSVFCFLFAIQASAANTNMHIEIEHLLQFVKNTDCAYERNGEKHSGVEAAKHIQKKYDYYEDDIDSAEKFIELSASKSTMSGKPYLIYCPNQEVITSQAWLRFALTQYRQRQAQSNKADDLAY